MKYKSIKALSIVLAVVLLCLSFAGCSKKTGDSAINLGGYHTNRYPMIVNNPENIKCDYLLVYNDVASYAEIDACVDLLENLNNKVNATFQICPDSLVITDSAQKIITLGVTGYAESEKSARVMDSVRSNNYYDYMLCSYGNVLTVNWVSKYGRDDAFNYLLETIFKGDTDSYFNGVYSYMYLSDRSDAPIVTIDDVNIVQYSVVLPSAPSYIERKNAERLVQAIKDATGVTVPLVTDNIEESTYEILIGDTVGRGEVVVTSFFDSKRFAVVQYGTKMILRGGQVEATAAAVSMFANMVNTAVVTAEPVYFNYGYCKTGSITSYQGNLFDGYTLKYYDDFEASSLNLSVWNNNDIDIPTYGASPSIMFFRPKNVLLENGNLSIITRLSSMGYVSGSVDSYNGVRLKYGYIEVKAKFRTAPGYWVKMMLTNQRDEKSAVSQIDVFNSLASSSLIFASVGQVDQESYYKDIVKLMEPSYLDGYRSGYLPDGKELNDQEYHTYGVEWTDDFIRYYIDGIHYATIETTESKFDHLNQELYMSFFVGVEMTEQYTDDEAAQWPAPYDIDWVRVYQKPGSTISFGATTTK